MGILTEITRVTVKHELVLRKSYQDQNLTNRLYSRIHQIIKDSESSAFSLHPRIHPIGQITLADGTLLTPSSNVKNLPDQNSQALSIAKLFPMHSLVVDGTPNTFTNIIACARVLNPQTISSSIKPFSYYKFDHFLGISVDGYIELVGTAIPHPSKVGCRILNLNVANGIIAAASTTQVRPDTLYEILPIDSNYVLYINTVQELRYLGVRGGTVIENQPILKGITNILASYSPNTGLVFSAETTNQKKINIEYPHTIYIGDHLNYVLRRP